MTDEELVGYADLHCQTPRALFHAKHLRRLYQLAGLAVPSGLRNVDRFFSAPEEDLRPVLDLIARNRHRAPKRPQLAALLAALVGTEPFTIRPEWWRSVLHEDLVELCATGAGRCHPENEGYVQTYPWTVTTVGEALERLVARDVFPMDTLDVKARRFRCTACVGGFLASGVACGCTRPCECVWLAPLRPFTVRIPSSFGEGKGPDAGLQYNPPDCPQCHNKRWLGDQTLAAPCSLWEVVSIYSLGPNLPACEALAQEFYTRLRPWMGPAAQVQPFTRVIWRIQRWNEYPAYQPTRAYGRADLALGLAPRELLECAQRAREKVVCADVPGAFLRRAKSIRELSVLWEACAQAGLTACDLVVKRDPSAGNLKSGRWKKAHHVRNAHCWWAVVRKGRCEPRGA